MATIKDVAKRAGVSVATVSRVLNDYDNVRGKTAQKVKDAIEELDYHPNFLGRTLRRLETMKILVVLPTISNQFYSRVVKGIQIAALAAGPKNSPNLRKGIRLSPPANWSRERRSPPFPSTTTVRRWTLPAS